MIARLLNVSIESLATHPELCRKCRFILTSGCSNAKLRFPLWTQGRWTPLVCAFGLGNGDSLSLALTDQSSLELGKGTHDLLFPPEPEAGQGRPEEPTGDELSALIDRLIELCAKPERSRDGLDAARHPASAGPLDESPRKGKR